MSTIVSARFSADHLVLPRPVMVSARNTEVHRRRVWYLELTDAQGRRAKGLAAPLPGFSAEGFDEVEGALQAISKAGGPVVGEELKDLDTITALVLGAPWPASVCHALEQALIGLLAQRHACEPRALLGGRHARAPFHVLVDDGWSAQLAVARGAAALKFKVRSGPDALDGVRAIRDAVGPDMRLHLDANGAWSLSEALTHRPQLEALGVALVEEPIADMDLGAMAAFKAQTTVTIAADESCRNERDLEAIIAAGAAGAVVLKPMLIGGVLKTVKLSERAAEAGLEVIITHCLDGAMGQASASLAATLCPAGALRSISADLSGDDEGIIAPLATAAMSHPEHCALKTNDEALSYRMLAEEASRFATWLFRQGVRPGQRVALRQSADRRSVVALHGLMWLGAVAMPIDPREGADAHRYDTLMALRPHVVLGTEFRGPWRSIDWPDTLPDEGLAPSHWALGDARLAIATSGTTGTPQPVTLTAEQLICSAMGSRARLGHQADDLWLCCLPLHHIGGLSILLRGAFNRITVELSSRFDPAQVADKLTNGALTLVSLVPTMLTQVLDHLGDDGIDARVRALLIGGAAMPDALVERCRRKALPVARTWGMSEAGSQVATNAPGDMQSGLTPLPLTEVTANDGVLTIHGRLVGARALRSGDRGWVDDVGRVHISGRHDRVIISGGENLDAEAIEAALTRHPAVQEACVIAYPHSHWGQRPGALLVKAPSVASPTRSALRTHFVDHLPSYCFPTRLAWVAELPKSALGKVALGRSAERLERLAESGRDLERCEALHVDTSVHVLSARSEQPIAGAGDLEIEGDRGPTEASDTHRDDEFLAEAHGLLEVGLGVDQGHAPAFAIEHLREGVVDGDQQGLVSRVAVLEDTPEKSDSSAINLEEAHSETMFKGHKDSKGRTR